MTDTHITMDCEQKFIRLIHKFDCAVAQLKHRGFIPSFDPVHWGLNISPDKTFILKPHGNRNDAVARLVHPLSIVLEGIKISEKIFGRRDHKDYQMFCNGHYPYLELERIFDLRCLQNPFSEGYQNQPSYTNTWARECPDQIENVIAFEVGRYLLNKHFKTRLKCAALPLFEKV